MLGLVSGYGYGGEFELETDHKPLEYIYNNHSKPSAQVEQWVLRLQAFKFKVVYHAGEHSIAVSLSCLRQPMTQCQAVEVDTAYQTAKSSMPTSTTAK